MQLILFVLSFSTLLSKSLIVNNLQSKESWILHRIHDHGQYSLWIPQNKFSPLQCFTGITYWHLTFFLNWILRLTVNVNGISSIFLAIYWESSYSHTCSSNWLIISWWGGVTKR